MRKNKLLVAILVLSLTVRLINLNQSLWLDEAINVIYARSNDFWWFITKYPIGDFHPAGWFFVLWIWGHLFGWSEISIRIPSVIFGVATVYFTYLIGKEIFSKKAGLTAALMLAVAPLHIYYSQEARMYSLSAFAVTLSIYSFILFMDKRKYSGFVFTVASILVLYSDYVAYFIFPCQFMYLLLWRKDLIKKYVFSLCIITLFFIPWLFILPEQLMGGQKIATIIPGWKEVVGGFSIKELFLLGIKTIVGRISFDNTLYYSIFVSVISAPLLIGLIKIKETINKKSFLVLCWLIVAPLLVWLFSLCIPVFSYFRLLYIVPAFYILVSLSLNKFTTIYFKIVLGLIVLTELIASGLYLFNDQNHRENWREASSLGSQNNAAVIFEDDTILAPYIYYNPKSFNVFPGLKNKPAESTDDVNNLQLQLLNKRNVLLFNYLVEITDSQRRVEQKLTELGYKKIKTFNYRGIGFIFLFSKI